MNHDDNQEPSSDIAIIGFASRFPGAENTARYWENLRHGVESIRSFSAADLEAAGVKKSLLRDPGYIRAGAPLAHIDAFDAAFFGISPREASIMDPQQRFFLEAAWESLEHAGYAPGTFPGLTGVFAGSGPNSYLFQNLLSDPALLEKDGIFLLRHTGNDKDVLATRISYQMNLRGPSVNVQTACSTSLVATHLACQSLLNYDCDMALAGAVSIELPHAVGYPYRQNEIQSHDGHCRAFDANATGTVFSSGLGLVVLRRLSDAHAAGDTIHAVIKGTAVNNDGNRKVGFLAPSVEGQVEVILQALSAANVEPASVSYVETHGTGTPIGDPIELTALNSAYGERDTALRIGSVKTNIGHTDTAAGMAGLLKTVLALGKKQIPPTLHFQKLNPLLESNAARIQVVAELTQWETDDAPRRAGVTSLGIGGTNAHAILEEPPEPRSTEVLRDAQLITLSAKTSAALDDATHALAAHLRRNSEENLADIANTLHVGRAEFPHRCMFVARTNAEAIHLADQPDSHSVVTGQKSAAHSIAFLFPGQGSQHVNMGRELYETEPVFRRWIDTCAELARPHLHFDFREMLFPASEAATNAAAEIKKTWNAQPLLFSVEYALAQLWISWGVRPHKLIGHSLGEYSAACVSGVFTLEDAVSLVCARGNLMKQVAEGSMLAIAQSESDAVKWLDADLSLAAVNSANQCVISGPTEAIAALEQKLKEQGISAHRLETSHAFHSRSIDPMFETFVELVRKVQLSPPQIPLVSNVSGTWLTDEEATDPAYWARHFRQTVRFADGLIALQEEHGTHLIEIGPGETLTALARQHAGDEALILPSLPRRSEKRADSSTILTALGSLWVHGVHVDWHAFHAHEKLRRVPLPTYPFQRKSHWIGPKIGTNWFADSLGRVNDWFYQTAWKPTAAPTSVAANGTWLVLCDPENSDILTELQKQNSDLVVVHPGKVYQAGTSGVFTIDLASEKDYVRLFETLAKRGKFPSRIIHLLSLATSLDTERCFHSLLSLIRACGGGSLEQPIAVTAFSQRSISVNDEPVLNPLGSLLAGPCRVAPLEFPSLRCRQVDIDTINLAQLADIILRENSDDDAPGNVVGYRNEQRWQQSVDHAHLDSAPSRLRDKGVYFITGGLGGLGMAVADSLARSHHARLVLVSRHGDKIDPAQQARFDEWRALGAEVLPLAADVTKRDSLARAVVEAKKKFGAINGIIHAAGLLQDGIIQLKKKDTARSVLAPKLEGVQILDELTRSEPLDFFALFSSVSALVPPDGQVDYCAANSFLNSFAKSRPAGRNFVVIAWSAWSQIGMVAPKQERALQPVPFNHPLLERVEVDTVASSIYSGDLSVEKHWVLGEHRFREGDSLLPGTAHLEIAVSSLWKKIGRQAITLENVVFLAPLRVASNHPAKVNAELRKTKAGYQFSVTSEDVTYVSCQCRPSPGHAPRMKIKDIIARCPDEKRDGPTNVRQRGHFDFGPRWQSLRQTWFGEGECVGLLEIPAEFRTDFPDYSLHPALMDVATGIAMYLVPGYEIPGDLLLPFAYRRLTVYGILPPRVYSHARIRHDSNSDLIVFDITIASENGDVIAEVEEFTVKRLRGVADLKKMEAPSTHSHRDSSHPQNAIPTREGIEAFHRIMKSRTSDAIYVSPTRLAFASPAKETEPLATSVTANVDDVGLVLAQLWESLLGLDYVESSTDFFDSGGHSLLAVRLFTEIRKRFNVDLGLSTLFEARTIGALAALIRKERAADPTQKNDSAAHTLVNIRTGGTNTPLFLIHDVGGSVLRYEHLARQLPDNQSVFAIESRGLSGLPTDYSVEEMAFHYIQQIRERQPKGPYFVAGHSFGGLVTYEIARQLVAKGETMGLVGLLDTYQRPITKDDARGETTIVRSDKLPIFARLKKDISNVVLGRDRIGYLRERKTFMQAWMIKTIYRSAYKFIKRYHWKMPPFLNDVKEANWIALDYYTPGAFEGDVALFLCADRLDTDPPDSAHVWRRLVKGDVVIHRVPGDHNSILREPNAGTLAREILSYLHSSSAAARLPLK